MREIENNINNMNIKGIQKPAIENAPTEEIADTKPESSKEIKDLKDMPAASLGKSQISKDSVEKDMQLLLKNPAQVSQFNMIFDTFQENHTYEEATQLMDAYRNVFMVKK